MAMLIIRSCHDQHFNPSLRFVPPCNGCTTSRRSRKQPEQATVELQAPSLHGLMVFELAPSLGKHLLAARLRYVATVLDVRIAPINMDS